jgi:hypothetical protein
MFMKVNEFIEVMSQSKNKVLKAEQRQELAKKILETKEYLSIKDKKRLVQDIVDECILYEDGVFKFDNIDKYVCFTMRTITAYTNLELSDDIEDDYDTLCEFGLLTAVVSTFTEEYDSVNLLLQMKCDYILSGNTMEAQFGKFLEGVSEKLDVLVEALSNKLGDLDVSKLIGDVSPEDVSKILSFVKTIN